MKPALENVLTAVNLTGVVVPVSKAKGDDRPYKFKLACANSIEYFFTDDPSWKDTLSYYSWNEVKVIGLLNEATMTLIPQKVLPKGPNGQTENVIDVSELRRRNLLKKVAKNINELVIIPIGLWAVLAA